MSGMQRISRIFLQRTRDTDRERERDTPIPIITLSYTSRTLRCEIGSVAGSSLHYPEFSSRIVCSPGFADAEAKANKAEKAEKDGSGRWDPRGWPQLDDSSENPWRVWSCASCACAEFHQTPHLLTPQTKIRR